MTVKNITFSQATLEAMDEEMSRDERVFVMGEDIARQGGIFGQFRGLPDKFGLERVRDTPISETAIIGSAVGAALAGMRPGTPGARWNHQSSRSPALTDR